MDLERLHKFSDNKLISLMRHYFQTINEYDSVSRDETINFLYYYNEYILRLNNIDTQNYNIVIHHDYSSEQNISAFMYKTKDVFHVHIQKKLLQEIIDKKRGALIELLIDAGHEFQHIVQYLQYNDDIADYETQKDDIASAIDAIPKVKKLKKLRHSLCQHNDSLNYLHPIELDADKKSYNYVLNLLNTLIVGEQNVDFIYDLLIYKKMVKMDRKSRGLELHKVKMTDDYSKRLILKSLDSNI